MRYEVVAVWVPAGLAAHLLEPILEFKNIWTTDA